MRLGSPSGLVARLSLLAVMGACSPSGTSGDDSTTAQDSAGVAIVEHDGSSLASLPEWGVLGPPLLDLGGRTDPSQQFTAVVGAARLPNGLLAVAEGRDNEVRLFDSAGTLIERIGRRGMGPGEFNRLEGIQLLPDGSLVGFDAARQSSFFAAHGAYLGHYINPRPINPGSYFTTIAHLASGGVVGSDRTARPAPQSAATPRWRQPYAVVLADTTGHITDTVAVLQGALLEASEIAEGGRQSLRWITVAFGGTSYVASDGRSIFIGTNEANEVHQYQGARLQRVIRNLTPGSPVTAQDRADWLAATLARIDLDPGSEEVKAERRRRIESTPFAEAHPFYGGLLVGTDGSLWVQAPQRYPDEARRYLVYDREGRPVARALLPEGTWPFQVGPTELIGMWRDADDVQHIRVWRLGPVGR